MAGFNSMVKPQPAVSPLGNPAANAVGTPPKAAVGPSAVGGSAPALGGAPQKSGPGSNAAKVRAKGPAGPRPAPMESKGMITVPEGLREQEAK